MVLLHAYAGSGKTTTAVEFARWYVLTGGLPGPIIFTSFEQYRPLSHLLDQLANTFQTLLTRSKIHWLTLTAPQRLNVAGQLLNMVPVLWIWDNVETVEGFPAGTSSASISPFS